MLGPSYARRYKKTTRYMLEVRSGSHDIEDESSDEGGVCREYNGNTVGGSSKVHMGDSNTTFNFYTPSQRLQDERTPRTRRHELLLDAVKTGQTPRVRYALGPELRASFDHRFHDELTALHIAVWHGHLECVKVLVEQGADVNATSFKYGTPLCVAAFRGHLHIVDALLGNYHASMDANGGWLGSPLHAACLRQSEVDGHVQSRLLRRLVKQRGTLSSSKKVNLGFCVHHREHLCAPDAIQCYLEGHPIHIAAYFGQKDAVDCLLALGDDIDSLAHLSEPKDSGNTETQDLTSLMLASMQYSNLETLATLLKKGASTELQDNNGFTALLYAASHISTQSSQRVVALINSGCDVNAMSHEGFTALTVAAQNGHNDCFSILRDAGANILSVDKRSWTAVKHAYSSGHLPALVQSTVQAMLFVSSRWFAVGLGWALKRLADACQQMHVAATYFDTAREANADNDSSGSGTNICLNHLIQLTEKCNAFLQHMALRTKQDSKPLFAVNDVVLSCSVLGFAPCLVPILILKWESDKTTLPWSIAAFSIFNKIRSLLSEIQEFLKEFESTTMEEKTPTVLDDPG